MGYVRVCERDGVRANPFANRHVHPAISLWPLFLSRSLCRHGCGSFGMRTMSIPIRRRVTSRPFARTHTRPLCVWLCMCAEGVCVCRKREAA